MKNNSNVVLSFVALILGGMLFILSAGPLIIPIIGAIVGLILINYGLELQNLPDLQTLLLQILNRFRK